MDKLGIFHANRIYVCRDPHQNLECVKREK